MIFRVPGISSYRNSRLAGKPADRLAFMTLHTFRSLLLTVPRDLASHHDKTHVWVGACPELVMNHRYACKHFGELRARKISLLGVSQREALNLSLCPHTCPRQVNMRCLSHNYMICLVGARGFEPPTSCSQSRRATGLRYAPTAESQ